MPRSALPSPGGPPPGTRRRLWWRAGIGVVAALLALLAGGWFAIHTPPVRRYVLAQVVELLEERRIGLAADSLDYSLLSLSVTVSNLSVWSLGAPELPRFLRAERVYVAVGLPSLLRGRYHVREGRIDGLDVHLVRDAGGRDNLPRPGGTARPAGPGDAAPRSYLIERFSIDVASVRYEDLRRSIDIVVRAPDLTVTGDPATGRHGVRLAGDGTIRYDGRRADLRGIAAALDLGQDDVRVDDLSIDTSMARIAASGSVVGFSQPALDLDVRVDASLEETAAFAGMAEPIGGAVRARAEIRGPLDRVEIAGTVEGSNLSFRTIAGMQLASALAYSGATRRVSIDDLRVTGPGGDVAARGAVALDADAGRSEIDASLDSVDAAALMRAAGLDQVVGSRIDGRVSASMPGLDYRAADASALLSLRPAGTVRAGIVPVGGTVALDVREYRQVSARLTQVGALGVTATGSVALAASGRLSGSLEIDAPDIARAIADTEVLLGRAPGTLAAVPLSGRATAAAQLGGTIAEPAADIVLAAPFLTAGQAAGMEVDGRLSYSPAAIALHAIDVRWQQALAHATGTIGLRGERPIAVDVRVDRMSIPDVLMALGASEVRGEGVIDATATIGGTVAAPRGDVAVRGEDLAAYGEALGQLTATVTLEPGSPVRADLRLEKPQADGAGVLALAGTYSIEERRFDAEIRSDRLQLTTLTLPGGVPVRARLALTGRAQGTVEDPEAALRLEIDGLEVQGHEVGAVRAAADVAARQARIRIDAARFGAQAEADIGLTEGYPARFALALRDLDFSALPIPADLALAGRLRATVEGSGNLSDPGTLTASATIESIDTTWNAQPIGLDGAAALRYDAERVLIDRFVLRALASTLSLSGDLPLAGAARPGAIEVDARLDLPSLAALAPPERRVAASGTARIAGRIVGSLEAMDPTLALTIEDGAIAAAGFDPGLTGVQARVEVSGGEVHVSDLLAAFGPARLQATARVPLGALSDRLPVALPPSAGEARVRLEVTDLDLSLLPGAPDQLSGQAAMIADLRASRPSIDAMGGQIEFSTLRVAFDALEFEQQGVSRIAIDRGVADVERLMLEGSAGEIAVHGRVDLGARRTIDLASAGRLDLAVLAALAGIAQADGPMTFEVAATGTLEDPIFQGFVDIDDARIVSFEPNVALEDLDARIDLSGDRFVLSRLSGTINGGALTGSGHVAIDAGEVSDLALAVSVSGMALDVPLDLRSLIDADIRVNRQEDLFVVGGEVTIQEAGLTRDLLLDRGLLARIASTRGLDLTVDRDPLLDRVRFDVHVVTASPVVLDNNLVRGEVTADLRVLGTPYEPGMSGRLVIEEDSSLTLNERTYVVERGVITFVEERRIVPVFDLRLTTRVVPYDVLLVVTGQPGDTETILTSPSHPDLPEPDVVALLVTGRTLEDVRGEEVAQAQVLSYVTGFAGSSIGRGIERATGLSRVRIEPNLISGETDPGARLTVGQDITGALRLIYSMDLVNGGDEIWIAEFDVTRRFQTRAVRQSDNSFRFDLHHDLRFGGEEPPKRTAARRSQAVGEVRLEGDLALDPAEVLRRFGIRRGNSYSFIDARRGVERVEELYRRAERLQSRVRLHRVEEGDLVHLTLDVEAGPRVEIVYEGASPPRRVQQQIAIGWQRGVFDAQRAGDAERVLRGWLVDRDHVGARLGHRIEDLEPSLRRVVFDIDAGPRYRTIGLAVEGAAGIPAADLEAIVREQRLLPALFTDPARVTDLIERYYREQGYLGAAVAPPRIDLSAGAARVILTVDEGPPFIVRRLETTGNRVFTSGALLDQVPLGVGDPYLPAVAERSTARIRELYGAIGHNDASVRQALDVNRETGDVQVTIAIEEGRREMLAAVDVEGTDRTSVGFVERQIAMEPGEPVAIAAVGQARRRLYDTRAFALVDITREEAADTGGAAGRGGGDPLADVPVRLNVAVQEVQPFRIRYGAFFDTERGFGGIADFSNQNSLGQARVVGLRVRLDGQLREGRIYLSQPALRGLPFETTANLFYTQERHPATPESVALSVDRLGFSVQQDVQLRRSYVLNYGYRFERQRTYDSDQPRQRDESGRVAPLTVTLSRERRDDVMDATRGQFLSQAFSVSPALLGADKPFLKYFGQFFTYQALEPERRERFTGAVIRPRLVYAGGVRLGLARGIGSGLVPPAERFLAGGSTTLRGFAQYSVGPVNADGFPGGEAMIVVNNEIRFPIVSLLGGVAFVDVGNVFARVADMSLKLRSSGGVGLRVRTPWFLGRVDYGVPFDRRAGEAPSQWFFSIGQAF